MGCRGAGCLSGVGTYVLGTVLQGCGQFKRCWYLPAGHCVARMQAAVLQGRQLFKWCWNLPDWHCVAGERAV